MSTVISLQHDDRENKSDTFTWTPLLGHLYLISLAGLFGVNTALADVDTFYAA
jgi:hypothetical protein